MEVTRLQAEVAGEGGSRRAAMMGIARGALVETSAGVRAAMSVAMVTTDVPAGEEAEAALVMQIRIPSALSALHTWGATADTVVAVAVRVARRRIVRTVAMAVLEAVEAEVARPAAMAVSAEAQETVVQADCSGEVGVPVAAEALPWVAQFLMTAVT